MEKGKKTKISDWKRAIFFVSRDLRGQKGRTIFLATVFVTAAAISFLFIGELSVYRDDRITKKYDNSAYIQQNDKRLSVRRYDGKALTKKDGEQIQKIKNVTEVDMNDYVNDIRYGTSKKKNNGFMHSDSGLTGEDLTEGKMPEKRQEIIVSADSPLKVGSRKRIYFSCKNLWGAGKKCWFDMTVTGKCSRKGEQIYFTPEFCHMLTPSMDGYSYRLDYDQDDMTRVYTKTRNFYPVIADDLKDNEVRVSKNYKFPSALDYQGNYMTVESALCGKILPYHVYRTQGSSVVEVGAKKDDTEPQLKLRNNGYLELQMDPGDQGGAFIEVSAELFEKLYPDPCAQASVYIRHYTKTDQVIKSLNKKGYDAVSTYRVSTTEYIMEKVFKRLRIIEFSTVVLVMLVFMMVLLLRQNVKQKQKELQLLRFMGMQQRPLRIMVYLELLGVDVLACLAVMLLFLCFGHRIRSIDRILDYQSIWSAAGYFVYNLSVVVIGVTMALNKFRSSTGWQKGRN